MFISEFCGCLNEDHILDSVDFCSQHNMQFKYVCLNKTENCMAFPLACPMCLQFHKGHQFVDIETYFTPEFKHILQTGTSLNGRSLARLSQHLFSDINKMRTKLNNQIDKLEQVVREQINKIGPKYPLKHKFGIPGSSIGQSNIVLLMNIVERQKNYIWVPATENYMRTLIGQVTGMIINLVNDLSNSLEGNQYEKFNEITSNQKITNFIKKYQGKYDPDRTHFQFSLFQKHENVRIFQNGIIAKFIDTNPSKPAVLSDSPFDKKNNTFYLKVTKLQKTAIIFDASVVFVGVCLPHIASIFGYRNLIEPSRGAFLVGSNGKCYHSSIQKYNKKALSFSFGQGDTVSVRVDFEQKKVFFSKWGFFVHNFSMQIDIKDEQMDKLRACVGFHGQKGVLVQIVNEDVFRLKQQQTRYQV